MIVEFIVDSNTFYVSQKRFNDDVKGKLSFLNIVFNSNTTPNDDDVVFENKKKKIDIQTVSSFIVDTDPECFKHIVKYIRGYVEYKDMFKAIHDINPKVCEQLELKGSESEEKSGGSIFSKSNTRQNDNTETYSELVPVTAGDNQRQGFVNVFGGADDTDTVLETMRDETEHSEPEVEPRKMFVGGRVQERHSANTGFSSTSYDNSSQRRYVRSRKIELDISKYR